MPVYSYQALDARRRKIDGTISADTSRQARDTLRREGLSVCEMMPVRQQRSLKLRWQRRFVTPKWATVDMTRELSTLLAVGVPLTDAMDTLIRQRQGKLRDGLMIIRDHVTAGSNLAEAMQRQGELFDELAIRMVEVGENSGTLDRVLARLADYREQQMQLRDRVVTALIYPAIVFAVSVLVSLFLMTIVVPMLLENLEDAGRDLPWPTQVLQVISDLLLERGVVLAAVTIVCLTALAVAVHTERGKWLWHRTLLRLPLIGPMALKQAVARAALVMATLIGNGVVYLTALDIAARATSNVVIRRALTSSGDAIRAGEEVSRALERTGEFPAMVVHVFAVGQQSGRLEEMLTRLAEDYDRQVKSLANRFATVLEPALILVLSLVVGFILFATLLPILEAGNVL